MKNIVQQIYKISNKKQKLRKEESIYKETYFTNNTSKQEKKNWKIIIIIIWDCVYVCCSYCKCIFCHNSINQAFIFVRNCKVFQLNPIGYLLATLIPLGQLFIRIENYSTRAAFILVWTTRIPTNTVWTCIIFH